MSSSLWVTWHNSLRFIHFVANGKISFLPWLRLLEALQNHRWVWTSWEAGLLSNDCFCRQPECMWNSVCVLKSGVCLLQPLPLPYAKSRGIQGQMSGDFLLGQDPWAGSDTLPLRGKLCDCDYPPLCGSTTQWCEPWLYLISDPTIHLCGSFFISLWLLASF